MADANTDCVKSYFFVKLCAAHCPCLLRSLLTNTWTTELSQQTGTAQPTRPDALVWAENIGKYRWRTKLGVTLVVMQTVDIKAECLHLGCVGSVETELALLGAHRQ